MEPTRTSTNAAPNGYELANELYFFGEWLDTERERSMANDKWGHEMDPAHVMKGFK